MILLMTSKRCEFDESQCFYQAAVTEADLLSGSFTVTACFVDFSTRRTIFYPIDIRVPEGSRYNSVLFATIFENNCDKIEAVPTYPHGKETGSKITKDMRVFARR